MKPVSDQLLDLLWHDFDAREERLREIVAGRMDSSPPPPLQDQVVATYFLALRSQKLESIAREIAYHATSGIKNPPSGSLLAECTGRAVGIDAWDSSGRIGLLHMAYPLKMFLNERSALTSSDLLHTTAGAILFDVYENQDARLLRLTLPEPIVQTFPGPAYGPAGFREATNLTSSEPAFGTIIKPTAGVTPEEVGAIVGEVAQSPLFAFIKEDENLYPRLPYSPVGKRVAESVAAIERRRPRDSGKGLIFAPHISSGPHELMDNLHQALENGATAVMFSESFALGAVRMVREATKGLPRPPMIYGHNAGIGVRTRCIWREVVDYLARLDGIDFRQTAPVLPGTPFIRPYRAEWEESERVLSMPIPGIKPVMIARAGGLDQGNIVLNLHDADHRKLIPSILFLSGSAINSIKGPSGKVDPQYAAEGMEQALEIFRSGELLNVPITEHLMALRSVAERRKYSALGAALRQRYPSAA